MLLPSNDGIRCDRCGKIFSKSFTYYSFDMFNIKVTNNIIPVIDFKATPELSLDICSNCIDEIGEIVIRNYTPTRASTGRYYKNGIYCELDKLHLIGNFTYYHCKVTKLDVLLVNGGNASVNMFKDFLEIMLCHKCYDKMRDTMIHICSIGDKNNGII